eukprot:403345921
MEIQPSDLFANEFVKNGNSVEPSPRFGDEDNDKDHNNLISSHQSSLIGKFYKQLNLPLQMKQQQQYIDDQEQENIYKQMQQQQQQQQQLNDFEIVIDKDNYELLTITSQNHHQRNSSLRKSQQMESNKNDGFNSPGQEDPHDFSFSQQLDNSSCIMDDQLSMTNQLINNTMTSQSLNNFNILESIQRKPKHSQFYENSNLESSSYANELDSFQMMQQSPPSNSQDAFKQFRTTMGGVQNQSLSQSRTQQNDYQTIDNHQQQSGVQIAFNQSLRQVESKWLDFQKWPESSPLRIELFSLEMQSIYGSYYRNKVKVSELINNLVKEESNRMAYIEAWKHKFRKTQRETMLAYIQTVEKNTEFLESLSTISKPQKSSQSSTSLNTNQSISKNQSIKSMKHQQSIEDLSPRQPPIMIQSQQHNYASTNNENRRKRAERGRSKTPPGELQTINSQQNKSTSSKLIPKLDLKTSININFAGIESQRNYQTQELQPHNKISSQISNDYQNSSFQSKNSHSPNYRMSQSYKNPFKKLVQQRQKLKQLQSPQQIRSPQQSKHNLNSSNKSPRQIENQIGSTSQNQQKSIKSKNSSNDSSPDMPAQLNTDLLSVYSQNQLLNSNNVSLLNSSRKTEQIKEEQVINHNEPYNIKSLSQIDEKQTTDQVEQNQQTVYQMKKSQQKTPVFNLRIDMNQQSDNYLGFKEDSLNNSAQQKESSILQEPLIESNQQINSDVIFEYNDNQAIPNTISNDLNLNQIISDCQESLQQQSSSQHSQDNYDFSQSQVEIQPIEDLDMFIQNQILYSLQSDRSKKSVTFSDHNHVQIFDELQDSQDCQQICDNESKKIIENEEITELEYDEFIESTTTQVDKQIFEEQIKQIVDLDDSQIQGPLRLQNTECKEQITNLKQNDIEMINKAKPIQEPKQELQLEMTQTSQNQYQSIIINQQEKAEFIFHTEPSKKCDQIENQREQQFKPKLNALSLTPQNKSNNQQFQFFKTIDSDIKQGQEFPSFKDFEVFSQQDTNQQGRFSSCCPSRISKLKTHKNYSFKNYVKLDEQLEQLELKFNNQNKFNSIYQHNRRKSVQPKELNFQQIDLNNVPRSLINIAQAYNQGDSIFVNYLLAQQTINDIVKYQDENAFYTISELRLDSQLQCQFRETFNLSQTDYRKYSLLKSYAQFYIPDAKRIQQLREEDGLVIIIKSVKENQKNQLFSRFKNFFNKDYDNHLQIIKLRTLEQAHRSTDKDLVEIRMFYCVDYNLLIDDELKQNNMNIAVQEVKNIMDAIRVYEREL